MWKVEVKREFRDTWRGTVEFTHSRILFRERTTKETSTDFFSRKIKTIKRIFTILANTERYYVRITTVREHWKRVGPTGRAFRRIQENIKPGFKRPAR